MITPTAEGLEEIRSVALDVATGLVSDRLQSLVVTSLSLGAFSPSLPFYDTLLTTQDACTTGMTFIIIPGRVVKCSVDEALQAVGEVKASSEIFENSFVEDWEHEVKSGSVNSSTVRVILHGPVGTSSFCTAHAKLFSAAMQGDLSYTLRHHSGGLPVVTNRTRLRGYGVYLDIKNMEYKNVDDRQASEDPESKDASEINSDLTAFQEDEVVNGVVFSTLLKRAPELHAELKLLRESLIDVSSADKNGQVEMKVWKMRDLGLQTLQVHIVIILYILQIVSIFKSSIFVIHRLFLLLKILLRKWLKSYKIFLCMPHRSLPLRFCPLSERMCMNSGRKVSLSICQSTVFF